MLAGLGEAAATRLLECTRRLALSTPQTHLLQGAWGGDSAGDVKNKQQHANAPGGYYSAGW